MDDVMGILFVQFKLELIPRGVVTKQKRNS